MYTLHARPGSGYLAIEALLAELDLPFEIMDVPRNPEKQPSLQRPYAGVVARPKVKSAWFRNNMP